MEASFLYTSTFGRTAANSTGWPAALWREYGKADLRWAEADPTVVALEILTVFIGGPLCFYIIHLMCRRRESSRHYWTIVLCSGCCFPSKLPLSDLKSAGELYGVSCRTYQMASDASKGLDDLCPGVAHWQSSESLTLTCWTHLISLPETRHLKLAVPLGLLDTHEQSVRSSLQGGCHLTFKASWVVIPLWLMWDSYQCIQATPTFRVTPSSPLQGKKRH